MKYHSKNDGVWKNFAESVPGGRKPLSNYDDLVLKVAEKNLRLNEQFSTEE
jgi:hypothetical protein